MPLVFVHGVNVRLGKKYEKEMTQRDQYFLNIFFKLLGRECTADNIVSPYWGDLATNLTIGSPYLPLRRKGKMAKAAGSEPQCDDLHDECNLESSDFSSDSETADESEDAPSLIELARTGSLDRVVDLIMATASDQAESTIEQAEGISKLAFRALRLNQRFQDYQDQMNWLDDVDDDAQLLSKLENELHQEESASQKNTSSLRHIRAAGDWLRENYGTTQAAKKRLDLRTKQVQSGIQQVVQSARTGVKKVRDVRRSATSHLAAAAITSPMRRLFHERLFLFIGDSFLYFGQRGTPQSPGPIVQKVSDALDEAWSKKGINGDSELIVVAHSMGGNIVTDIASHFRPDREIDILITVASQFPLFADLHMFPGLETRNRPIAKPPNVKRWINFYDVNDVFAFTAQPMFHDVEDVDFASGKLGITTHADCFKFVSLYERMAEAVQKTVVPLHK